MIGNIILLLLLLSHSSNEKLVLFPFPGVILNRHGRAEKENTYYHLVIGEICLHQMENFVMVE